MTKKRCSAEWLGRHTDVPFDLKMIAGTGSGESLERREVAEAAFEVETGTYDLVLAEDLGRIFRRVHAQLFCEACEDVQTRLIAINDSLDTAQDNWRMVAGFANMRHEAYNADTGKRIRRSLRNRFQQGGVFQVAIVGYIKPPGAVGESDVRKDEAWTERYQEWFRRLDGGARFAEIADWLNGAGIPVGPYCKDQAARTWKHGRAHYAQSHLEGRSCPQPQDGQTRKQDRPAEIGQCAFGRTARAGLSAPGTYRTSVLRPCSQEGQ